MNEIKLTDTEKRVLTSLHLQGCTGSMGNMKLQDRRKLIHSLIDKGLLSNDGRVTQLGIEAAAPKF